MPPIQPTDTDLSPATSRRRARPGHARPRQTTPALVWLATALFIALGALFTVLYPPYQGFDETGHVSRVLETQAGRLTPTPGIDPYVEGVSASYQLFTTKDQPPFVEYTPPPRADRPSFAALGGGRAYPHNALPNQLAEHPPGYYLLAAWVLDVIPGSSHLAWDQTIDLLRLFDVLLLAPLPYLCWAAARRFARPPIASAASFAPAMVPALTRVGGSVTNDDLIILVFGVFCVLAAHVVDGDRRLRTAAAVAACIAISLLVKGFALVLPPIALLAYLVGWWRSRGVFPWRPLVVTAVGSALGGLWWLRNLLVYHQLQPPGLTSVQAAQVWPPLPAGQHGHFGEFLRRCVDIFTTDFWGALGQAYPPRLPGVLTVLATIVFAALVVLGLWRGRRSGGLHVLALGVLLLPTILVAAPLLVHGWPVYARTGQPAGIQGRYLYPGLVGSVAVAAGGTEALTARIGKAAERLLPLLASAAAVGMSATAVWVVVAEDWLPAHTAVFGHAGRALHAIGAQSPWPGQWTAAILIAVAAAAVLSLLAGLVSLAPRPAPAVSAQPAMLSRYQA